ncbi:MAG: hypothetical protein K2N49_02010 [Ruminococcus sp.]|nr:hypothetical protein [Ruminococcus sp.]MDE7225624.1 hypothetical protein [Ruminococcus sp.]
MQAPQYQIPQNIPQAVQQPQNSNSVIWVQGEAGAKSYLVAPGQTVWLMDSENLVFYIKSTDPSGMPLPLRKNCIQKQLFRETSKMVNLC